MGHEAGRGCAVPVFLIRLEEHAVTRTDRLDRAAAALREADALGDVDRLPVRGRVPCGSGAWREVDAGGLNAGRSCWRGEGVEVDGACEPVAWSGRRLDRVSC